MEEETIPWWKELEKVNNLQKRWKWCCKLFREGNFEEFIQNEIGIYVGLRLKLSFCPHCGRQMTQTPPRMHWHYCCYLFRDLGLEGMQFEEKVPDGYGGIETHIHRLRMNYCFHCG